MGNFFGEIAHRVGDLVSYPVKMSKDLVTHPKKGWNELTHLYSHNEHKDQDLFQKGFGIHGWVGKHPQETAAAVVATIFGGWAAWGAYGAGAAGGATAGASGAMGGTAAAGAGGTAGSGVAAGTVIGQTVPATPGMIAAANGGGAAIGTGANAVSASYAATAGTGSSFNILAGAGYGVNGAYPTTLGGEAQIGNTGLTSGSSWQDWAQNINRARSMMNQNGQQQGQAAPQTQPQHDLLAQLMQGQKQQSTADNQSMNLPQTTAQTFSTNKQYQGTDFSNQFGGY